MTARGRMDLQIVWQNPAKFPDRNPRLERLLTDQYGAVYVIRESDVTKVFELLPGRAA